MGPDGQIVAPDRSGTPREILSPLVARNGFASYQIVVRVPADKPFQLYIAQNPEGSIQTALYHAEFSGGVPNRLTKVTPPARGRGAVDCYWLDLWIPPDATPGRMRVEAQLNVDDRWIIYPMEIRIAETRIPKIDTPLTLMPSPDLPSDTAAYGPWRAVTCGVDPNGRPGVDDVPSVFYMIQRNAWQDVALAGERGDKTLWCGPETPGRNGNPEWYLRLRDELIRRR